MTVKVESKTEWTVTDDDGAIATIRIDENDDGPTLKIEQGDDHMVWLDAASAPAVIKALQAAYDEFTGAIKP